tara:strand:- start:120 stop:434 length:315 start_codon:yes stop_codon:yes gene_type:complete
MANPFKVVCPAGVWVRVAQSLTAGVIFFKRKNVLYLYTYRIAGDPAPTDATDDDIALEINFSTLPALGYPPSDHGVGFSPRGGVASDVYVQAVGTNAGLVVIHS